MLVLQEYGNLWDTSCSLSEHLYWVEGVVLKSMEKVRMLMNVRSLLGTEILVQLNLDISKIDYSNNIYISKLYGTTCINHSFLMNCNLCFLNVRLNLQLKVSFSGFYEVQDKDFWGLTVSQILFKCYRYLFYEKN